jgi:hypothetical protein
MPLIRLLRRKPVVPLFNPATLALTGWWKAYPGASPWSGSASTGTSASYTATLAAGSDLSFNTLSGNTYASWTADSGQYYTTATNFGNFFSSSGGFYAGLVRPNTATADLGAGQRRSNGHCFWSDGPTAGGYIGCGASSTGPFAYMYGSSTSYKDLVYPLGNPLNVWMAIFMYWDGTTLYLQVNNGAPISVGATLTTYTNPIFFGRSTVATKSYGGDTAEYMFSNINLASSISNIYSYFKGKYPLAGLP